MYVSLSFDLQRPISPIFFEFHLHHNIRWTTALLKTFLGTIVRNSYACCGLVSSKFINLYKRTFLLAYIFIYYMSFFIFDGALYFRADIIRVFVVDSVFNKDNCFVAVFWLTVNENSCNFCCIYLIKIVILNFRSLFSKVFSILFTFIYLFVLYQIIYILILFLLLCLNWSASNF